MAVELLPSLHAVQIDFGFPTLDQVYPAWEARARADCSYYRQSRAESERGEAGLSHRLNYRFAMRFNHMELTFARGTLTDEFRGAVDDFYGSVFGWKATDTDVVGQRCHILLPDPDQFILLAESSKPMSSPGFDHLGLLQDTRAEVDELHEACKSYGERDDRVQIQEYEDLEYPGLTVHAFYVKYLLPIYFDVQSMERS